MKELKLTIWLYYIPEQQMDIQWLQITEGSESVLFIKITNIYSVVLWIERAVLEQRPFVRKKKIYINSKEKTGHYTGDKQ